GFENYRDNEHHGRKLAGSAPAENNGGLGVMKKTRAAPLRECVPYWQQSRRFALETALTNSIPIKNRLKVFDGGPPWAAKPLLVHPMG
ncbi:MAG: hypothetical protein ACM3TN_09420, partial [Alphaproteobacteria bacterium]